MLLDFVKRDARIHKLCHVVFLCHDYNKNQFQWIFVTKKEMQKQIEHKHNFMVR